MIADSYKAYLEEELGGAIKANIEDATYSFHNDFYYDDDSNIRITLKMLPGQIQLGVVQYPIQIMIECDDKFKDDLMPVLNDFALTYNEHLVTLDNEEYREYYTTASIINTFINNGVNRRCSITMEASLINFDNVSRVKSITIKYGSQATDTVSINNLDFTMSYEAETSSTGAVGTQETKSVTKSFVRTLNFAFVPISSAGVDDLLTSVLKRTTSKVYKITVVFKGQTDIVYDEYVELKSGAYSSQLQSFPVCRVVFIKSKVQEVG